MGKMAPRIALALFLLGLVSSQSTYPCQCGLFVNTVFYADEDPMYMLEEIQVDDPCETESCDFNCATQGRAWDEEFELTDQNPQDPLNRTLGDSFCARVNGTLESPGEQLYSSARNPECPIFDDWSIQRHASIHFLCCDGQGLYVPC